MTRPLSSLWYRFRREGTRDYVVYAVSRHTGSIVDCVGHCTTYRSADRLCARLNGGVPE